MRDHKSRDWKESKIHSAKEARIEGLQESKRGIQEEYTKSILKNHPEIPVIAALLRTFFLSEHVKRKLIVHHTFSIFNITYFAAYRAID